MAGTNSNSEGKMSREEAGRLGGQAYHEKRGATGSDSNSSQRKQGNRGGRNTTDNQ